MMMYPSHYGSAVGKRYYGEIFNNKLRSEGWRSHSVHADRSWKACLSRVNISLVPKESLVLMRASARIMGLLESMASKHYFPSFSTRPFEFKAYAHCTEMIKDSIIPIVTLTRQSRAESFSDSIDLVSDASQGRPVIVDFDRTPRPLTTEAEAADKRRQKAEKRGTPSRDRSKKELAHYAELRRETEQFNAHLSGLKDPVTGSVSWIRMASAHAGMVPIVRLVSAEAVTAQIQAANASGIAVAFRIDPEDQLQVGLAGRGLSGLRQPGSAFLILDAGDVRNRVSSACAAAESAFRSLRNAAGESFERVRKTLVSGSFPSSSLRDLPRLLPMEEGLLYERVSGSWQVEYGDHASLPKRSARSGSNGWFPHVDLTLDGHWRIELEERNSDRTGYGRCARATIASGEWKSRTECWGTSVVKEVADGSTTVGGVKFVVPAAWLSVRANQHISRFARDR
ncbi:hypothetical protein [Mesorhizobium sp. M4B.F.Ca.ET.049.02.1.2]|uniref:beta family protein n=1 Tax=Mesorhizobium sp. M4B.F.Ca.ET.049.02.1.2 TaxID=2496752 RepID=UPI0016734F1E|nr:hypothetical protein [Mesorhizobium sp. M4B.F.Ca.ET.049.02.1.2]